MKRLAAVALIASWVAIPAFAQRLAASGGAAIHSAPAFHGSSGGSAPRFSGSASRFAGSGPRNVGSAPRYNPPSPAPGSPRRFTGAARSYNPGRSLIPAHTFPHGGPGGTGEYRNNGRTNDPDSRHHRMPYHPGPRDGYPYYPYGVTGSVGWVSPYVLGYGDSTDNSGDAQGSSDNDNSGANAGQAYDQGYAEDNGPPPPNQAPQQALPPWPSSDPSHANANPPPQVQAPEPPSQEAVTLVFKDGRPPEQIHNYLLTATTLYVQDQAPHHRDIPLGQLDLVATAKVNHDSGVDFRLPGTPK